MWTCVNGLVGVDATPDATGRCNQPAYAEFHRGMHRLASPQLRRVCEKRYGFAPKSLLSTPSFKSHLSILLLNYWKYKYKWFIDGRWKFLSSWIWLVYKVTRLIYLYFVLNRWKEQLNMADYNLYSIWIFFTIDLRKLELIDLNPCLFYC